MIVRSEVWALNYEIQDNIIKARIILYKVVHLVLYKACMCQDVEFIEEKGTFAYMNILAEKSMVHIDLLYI